MKTYSIDYSKVKTGEDLLQWVDQEFPKLNRQKNYKKGDKYSEGVCQIWDYFIEKGIRNVIVYESYPRHASSLIKKIMKEWKVVLGFHLNRDHLITVDFQPNPETKNKRPNANQAVV